MPWADGRAVAEQDGLGATVKNQPPARWSLTEASLCDWIAVASCGAVIQYNVGHLSVDRSLAMSSLSAKERVRLDTVARRAWIACELGLVKLFSQKVEEGHYLYFAVRSQAPLTLPRIRALVRVTAVAGNDGCFGEAA